jgi:hypothetical protein
MTVETRYMRSDQQTVNGLLAYILGVTQSTSSLSQFVEASGNVAVYWASDVVVRSVGGSETVIGTKVAQVFRTTVGAGIQSATWVCPETALASTDSVVIRVYIKLGTGAWNLVATFTSEQLGASKLDGATWTFYYYTVRSYESVDNITTGQFYWGTSTYNSRIENFTWTPLVVAIASKRMLVGVGL